MSTDPTPDDAQVVLKLYELRREDVMRESRLTMLSWKPTSFEDVVAIIDFGHPDNAAWRQVSSYFEMAFGMAHHGAVHAELLAESTGEGLLLFAKIHPFLEQIREQFSPTAFAHAEWIAETTEFGRQRFKLFRSRMEAK